MTTVQAIVSFSVLAGLFMSLALIFWIATRIEPVELSRLEKHERRMIRRRWFQNFLWFMVAESTSQAVALMIRDYFHLRGQEVENLRLGLALFYAGVWMLWTLVDLRAPLTLISLTETPAETAARMIANLKPIKINFHADTTEATRALDKMARILRDAIKKGGS